MLPITLGCFTRKHFCYINVDWVVITAHMIVLAGQRHYLGGPSHVSENGDSIACPKGRLLPWIRSMHMGSTVFVLKMSDVVMGVNSVACGLWPVVCGLSDALM